MGFFRVILYFHAAFTGFGGLEMYDIFNGGLSNRLLLFLGYQEERFVPYNTE